MPDALYTQPPWEHGRTVNGNLAIFQEGEEVSGHSPLPKELRVRNAALAAKAPELLQMLQKAGHTLANVATLIRNDEIGKDKARQYLSRRFDEVDDLLDDIGVHPTDDPDHLISDMVKEGDFGGESA